MMSAKLREDTEHTKGNSSAEKQSVCIFSESQLKNIEFFYRHLDGYLADEYLYGKYAVIYRETLINSFATFRLASWWSMANLPGGTFFIQRVERGNEIINALWAVVWAAGNK